MPLCEDTEQDMMRAPGTCCKQDPDDTDSWCLALKCHQKIIYGMEKCGLLSVTIVLLKGPFNYVSMKIKINIIFSL